MSKSRKRTIGGGSRGRLSDEDLQQETHTGRCQTAAISDRKEEPNFLPTSAFCSSMSSERIVRPANGPAMNWTGWKSIDSVEASLPCWYWEQRDQLAK